MSIDELALAVGISNATANRFARALGFDGYPQFRAELVCGFESLLAPVEQIHKEVTQYTSSGDIFVRTLDEDMDNLTVTRRLLNPEACERAVQLIVNAERIFIIGYGASAFLSGLMGHALAPFCKSVQYNLGSGGPSHVARQLLQFKPDDLVIGISFPKYAKDTLNLLAQVHESQVPIIAITDMPSSPLAQLAEITLYAQSHRQLLPNSEGAALCLIEALCCAVAHHANASKEIKRDVAEFTLPWLAPSASMATRR